MEPLISIILPVRNEQKYIRECLESIINSEYPKDKMEVFVVDGNSNDSTLKIVKDYQKEFDFIKIIINEKKIVPVALNLGIKESKGEYIIRLDAHSKYPKDYFSKLIHWALKLDSDNVGALALTDVLNVNRESISIKKVMSDKYGVGNSLFRIGVEKPMKVDTVPFGCYKRNVFNKFGFFDERLERNQDIEFNKRISRNGGSIYLVPDIKLTYFCRDKYFDIFINRFNTGKWIIKTSYYTKTFNNLGVRHFVPLLFLLSIILPLSLSFFFKESIFISILSCILYLGLVLNRSFKLVDKNTSVFHLLLSFIIIHISYGLGSLRGIIDITVIKIKEDN